MRHQVLAPFVVLAVVGCGDRWRSGTAVGNPGNASVMMSRVPGADLSGAVVQLEGLMAEPCDGRAQATEVGDLVDLLVPSAIRLAGGEHCSVVLDWSAPLIVTGTRDDGRDLRVDLPVDDLRFTPVEASLPVDGRDFVIEIGDGTWLPEPTPRAQAEQLARTSSMYVDLDGDGRIGPVERERGPIAVGASLPGTGTGGSTTPTGDTGADAATAVSRTPSTSPDEIGRGLGFVVYYDKDGDGYGDPTMAKTAWTIPEGYVRDGDDCDDNDPDKTSGIETCDGTDNDCDGTIDEDGVCPYPIEYNDGQAYMIGTTKLSFDAAREEASRYGYTLVEINDQAEQAWLAGVLATPWRLQEVYIGLSDEAVEGAWTWEDGDAADFVAWVDDEPGDDNKKNVALMDDGKGYRWKDEERTKERYWVAEHDTSPPCDPSQTMYYDGDGDGFGDGSVPHTGCPTPVGFVSEGIDCDDADPSKTGGPEICDGTDNDCDGTIDEDAVCPYPVHHYDGRAYLFGTKKMDIAGARAVAASHGYRLVSIEDQLENDWIVSIVDGTYDMDQVFIGFDDTAVEGNWVWPYGVAGAFDDWAPGEPGTDDGKNAALMHHGEGFQWEDHDAGHSHYWVAEVPW